MQTYLETAQGMVAEVFASPVMRGIIRQGRYKRVTPATMSSTGTTLESPTIAVLLYQFNGQGPVAEQLWKPKDRVGMIQQTDLAEFGEPQEKDQLIIFAQPHAGVPETLYQVLRGWEESPGLMWHVQLRN